ncbi:MAG TPA: MFS transporter [Burkholderiaceae bacterium]|nr:MFS transporter [Burkholderiaceae bacterium]
MSIWHGASPPGGGPDRDGERQPVRRALVFSIVALALMMMSIDSTIVATALHTLQHDLGTSVNWAGWTITAYSFGFVLMLPVSGKLAEQYGRRRVFIGSVFAFTAASLLCGFADNIYVLIALRALQAAGGAGFTPSATGIIVDHFGDERDRAVSFFGSIFPIGAMIGPIFGGLFVTYWSWRGIFLINVPIGIAVLLLALRYIPHDRPRAAKADARRDFAGMALLGCGVLAAMLAISILGEADAPGWRWAFAAPLCVAVVALWAFFRHIERAAHPFIAPRLIHGPGFGAVNLINALFGGMPTGAVALIPLYATNRYAIDALRSGTLLVAQGAATTLLSIAAALLIRQTGYRLPMRVGGVVSAVGIVLLAFPPPASVSPYTWLAGAAFLVGAGRGTLNPASRNAGLQLAPEQASTLAALRSMGMNIGTITTIAIATAVISGAADSGGVQAWTYVAIAVCLVAALPLIGRVTEHRGSW